MVGESCKNAATLAVKEINDAGGLEVGGTKLPVTLQIDDNEDKPESAAAVAERQASAGMLAMIGPNASGDAIPAAEVAESSRMPMISPWSTNPKLTMNSTTGQPKTEVFRAAFTDDFQGVVAAKFALGELQSKKPAVLYDVASEYNKGIAEVFKQTVEAAGVKLVAFETYTSGDKDFSSQLTRLVKAGADLLFLPNYYSEVPLQVKQARQRGYQGKILGSDSWGSGELLKLAGDSVRGLLLHHPLRPRHRHAPGPGLHQGLRGRLRQDARRRSRPYLRLFWPALLRDQGRRQGRPRGRPRRPRRHHQLRGRHRHYAVQGYPATPSRAPSSSRSSRASSSSTRPPNPKHALPVGADFGGRPRPTISARVRRAQSGSLPAPTGGCPAATGAKSVPTPPPSMYLLQQTLNALQVGSVYALIALGYTMGLRHPLAD